MMRKKYLLLVFGLCFSMTLSGCGGIFSLKNIQKIGKIVATLNDKEDATEPEEPKEPQESDESNEGESTEMSVEKPSDGETEESTEGEGSSQESAEEPPQQVITQWGYGDRLVLFDREKIVGEDGEGKALELGQIHLGENESVDSIISFKNDVLYAVSGITYGEDTYDFYADIISLNTGEILFSAPAYSIQWIVDEDKDGVIFYYSVYGDEATTWYWYKITQDKNGDYQVEQVYQDRTATLLKLQDEGYSFMVFDNRVKYMGNNEHIYMTSDMDDDLYVFNNDGSLYQRLVMDNKINYGMVVGEKGMVFNSAVYPEGSDYANFNYIYLDFETLEEIAINDTGADASDRVNYNPRDIIGNKIYYEVYTYATGGKDTSSLYVFDIDTRQTDKVFDKVSVPGSTYEESDNLFRYDISDHGVLTPFADGAKAFYKIVDDNGQVTDTGLEAVTFHNMLFGDIDYESDVYKLETEDTTYFTSYRENFRFTTSDPGVDKMNEALEQFDKEQASYALEGADNAKEYLDEGEWFPGMTCSYDVNVMDVREVGKGYYGVDFQMYDYTGGAHGMPYMTYMLFDKQSGAQVTFKDLYQGTEEEFREIVTRYTVQDWKNSQDNYKYYFWESEQDAYDAIYESTSLDMDVRFENDSVSVVFYPYSIGPYAAGFIEIAIPYEEFGFSIE